MLKNNSTSIKQLNPFEIKAEIANLSEKLNSVNDFENYELHYKILDAQNDKEIISKILLKEVPRLKDQGGLIKFLLKRYAQEELLITTLWGMVKNPMTSSLAKIFALDLLREIDANWSYETCDEYLENPSEFIDEDTKRILTTAILNPEVQIDFLDFINSIPKADKLILIRSLANDYQKEELANVLIPLFMSQSDSEVGQEALEILGDSKSQLAFHALSSAIELVPESLQGAVKKNLSKLKLSGVRADNAFEFYSEIMKNTTLYKTCITYPDGHGNVAFIISRMNKVGKVQFVAIVADDYQGIRDCFGFNDISQFECNTIIDKFYQNEKRVDISPSLMKSLLAHYEKISAKTNNWLMPYEYVCWKNLLADVELEEANIEEILKNNIDTSTVSQNDIDEITKSDFTLHWFLEAGYSDEFDTFLNDINLSNPNDFDEIIKANLLNVFYPEEFTNWTRRLSIVAYIKYKEGLLLEAQQIYSICNDLEALKKFFANILRMSIYQHYYKLNLQDIDDASEIIKSIEKMWVDNDA